GRIGSEGNGTAIWRGQRSEVGGQGEPNSLCARRAQLQNRRTVFWWAVDFWGWMARKNEKIVFWGAMKKPKTIKNKGNMHKIFRSLKKLILESYFDKVVICWAVSSYIEKLQSLLSIKWHPM
ncbi:MAG: hypothetical protein WAO89_09870, partial [Kiritimatiellia bacterium]